MSIASEKLRAQNLAFFDHPTRPWHRHLVGPVEMETLLVAADENLQRGVTLATLCDLVLGEDSPDRSDDALLRGVRRLVGPKP